MQVRLARVLIRIAFLMVATLCGYIGYNIAWSQKHELTVKGYEEWQGLQRRDGIAALMSPVSIIGVTEVESDFDQDGVVEQWDVNVKEGQPLQLSYHMLDTNSDGNPDSVTIDFNRKNLLFLTQDDDGDGIINRQTLALRSQTGSPWWFIYDDLNLNGSFDRMEVRIQEEGKSELPQEVDNVFVLLESTWVPLAKVIGKTKGYIERDGEEVPVLFDQEQGQWVIN